MDLDGGSLTDICLLLLAKWHVIGGAEWLSPFHWSMDESTVPPWWSLIKEMEGRWGGGGVGGQEVKAEGMLGRTLREHVSLCVWVGEWGGGSVAR